MDNWNGKHPVPWEYFFSMNTGSGKDLTWFWNNWFYSNNYIDLKIADAIQQNNKLNINIENVGGFAMPFDAVVAYTDGTKEIKHFTPAIWEKDQKKTILDIPVKKQVKSVNLDGGIFMDYTPQDNLKIF